MADTETPEEKKKRLNYETIKRYRKTRQGKESVRRSNINLKKRKAEQGFKPTLFYCREEHRQKIRDFIASLEE